MFDYDHLKETMKRERNFDIDSLEKEDNENSIPMDPKIKPLVLTLNYYGIPTTGSCEGHIESKGRNPWVVMIRPDNELKFKGILIQNDGPGKMIPSLKPIIQRFNREDYVQWRVCIDTDGGPLSMLECIPTYSVSEMHQSIYRLADAIYQSKPL